MNIYTLVLPLTLFIIVGFLNIYYKNRFILIELILSILSFIILFLDIIIHKNNNAYFLIVISIVWVSKSIKALRKG
jgi:hypothetical protein